MSVYSMEINISMKSGDQTELHFNTSFNVVQKEKDENKQTNKV